MKACRKCGEVLPFASFPRCSRYEDGLQRQCRSCLAAVRKARRDNNPDQVKANHARYQERHREELKERARDYRNRNGEKRKVAARRCYEQHREAIIEATKRRRAANPERVDAANRAWKARNSDKVRAIKRAYREKNKATIVEQQKTWKRANADRINARRRALYQQDPDRFLTYIHRQRTKGGTLAPEELAGLRERYEGRCPSCGKEASLTIDHVVPISLGGRTDADNIQFLCLSCNSRKGRQIVDYR